MPGLAIRRRSAVARRRGGIARLGAALATGAALLLAGCSNAGILSPAGPIAAANRTILLDCLVIMLVIVVPTMIATLAIAWWYRAGNDKARFNPEFTYSGRVEVIVWSIPILVILFLGGLIWTGSHDIDPRRPIASDSETLDIQVVSLDWKWLFIYPQQAVASINRLVVPAGVPVRFKLTSASVMNAFFVPQLGSMIYTMNGMATEVNLRADAPGTFYGQSAHYSGEGFSGMHFAVEAVPQETFDAFVAGARSAGQTLNAETYRELSVQSENVAPFTYRAVQPGLFDAVVAGSLAPASGPQAATMTGSKIPAGSMEESQ